MERSERFRSFELPPVSPPFHTVACAGLECGCPFCRDWHPIGFRGDPWQVVRTLSQLVPDPEDPCVQVLACGGVRGHPGYFTQLLLKEPSGVCEPDKSTDPECVCDSKGQPTGGLMVGNHDLQRHQSPHSPLRLQPRNEDGCKLFGVVGDDGLGKHGSGCINPECKESTDQTIFSLCGFSWQAFAPRGWLAKGYTIESMGPNSGLEVVFYLACLCFVKRMRPSKKRFETSPASQSKYV
ncbi:MAG: hypothetical protein BWY82_00789 [Verrucomicrobia bacterium ADurb.Bin474]|nr:MAG: hypothetical protein BWY82_00789 [Verrucomicrobia bacterium ADurb.Bin474]